MTKQLVVQIYMKRIDLIMGSIFNLPTFSVNPQATEDKQKRIIKLIKQANASNMDVLGEAFIRIIEADKPNRDMASLSKFAKTYRACQIIEEARKQTVSLEEQFEELESSEISKFIPSVSFEDEVIKRCDTEYMVEQFLAFRQKWVFKDGYDISRLLELALLDNDVQATWKLRWIFEENKEMDYLKDLLQNAGAIERIKTLLWDKKIILDT